VSCEGQWRRGNCESLGVVCNKIVKMCKMMDLHSVLDCLDVVS